MTKRYRTLKESKKDLEEAKRNGTCPGKVRELRRYLHHLAQCKKLGLEKRQ